MNLPPGFRFYPSDEQLVVHFLQRKAALLPCHPDVIPDLDLYPHDPWELNGKALVEGNQWYFYSRRTQCRTTNNGYWISMGIDEPIFSSCTNKLVGMKKYYMFYIGEYSASSPAAAKTNWVLEEYRLSEHHSGSSSSRSSSKPKKRSHGPQIDYSNWVVCRVYEQSLGDKNDDGTELSCLDEVFLSLDDLDEISLPIR